MNQQKVQRPTSNADGKIFGSAGEQIFGALIERPRVHASIARAGNKSVNKVGRSSNNSDLLRRRIYRFLNLLEHSSIQEPGTLNFYFGASVIDEEVNAAAVELTP